jgi:hypothetical protein
MNTLPQKITVTLKKEHIARYIEACSKSDFNLFLSKSCPFYFAATDVISNVNGMGFHTIFADESKTLYTALDRGKVESLTDKFNTKFSKSPECQELLNNWEPQEFEFELDKKDEI